MNYYNILQIEETASPEEIKQAYHKMARLFHPDNYNGSKEDAEEQMRKINEAYDVLSDVEKRSLYDEERKDNTYNKFEADIDFEYDKGNEREDEEVYSGDSSTKQKSSGCSSCLAKIIEYAIYIGIIVFIINHFNLGDKFSNVIKNSGISQTISDILPEKNMNSMKPEEIIEEYFRAIRKGNDSRANDLFSTKIGNDFHNTTVKEFNKTIVDVYYGLDNNSPLYPLAEVIRKFHYEIENVVVDDNKNASVQITIENCDVALLFGLLMASDYDNTLVNLSDSEMKEVVTNAIDMYGSDCMISTTVMFDLVKDDVGAWKISDISPMKDFSKVIIGQADDLILGLNGENPNDYGDTKEDSKTTDYNYDYEDYLPESEPAIDSAEESLDDENNYEDDGSALKYAGSYTGMGGYDIIFSAFSNVENEEIGAVDIYFEGVYLETQMVYVCHDKGDWSESDYDALYVIHRDGYYEYLGFFVQEGNYMLDYNGATKNYDMLEMTE